MGNPVETMILHTGHLSCILPTKKNKHSKS